MEKRAELIRTASLIALFGNALLALLKIGAGFYAGSLAVVGDGIDSSTDVAIALMSLMVAGIIARPADAEHPWGHGRAETVATTILSFILFFAGGQLILNAAGALLSRAEVAVPGPAALVVTVFSILAKIALAWSQYHFGRLSGSSMLKANGKNMASDVVISTGVLLGLALSIFLGIGWIDAIAAVLVGLWVIKAAVGVFLEANTELMDGNADTGPYSAVFQAVRSVPGAGNPHRARMRRIAGLWDIDLDIEVQPTMTVRRAHQVACEVERAIKETVEGVYDIVVHVEPSGEGDSHESEGFGLSEGGL